MQEVLLNKLHGNEQKQGRGTQVATATQSPFLPSQVVSKRFWMSPAQFRMSQVFKQFVPTSFCIRVLSNTDQCVVAK